MGYDFCGMQLNPTQNGMILKMRLLFSSGPVGGITQYSGTGKSLGSKYITSGQIRWWTVNVGGFFGPFLKFSGFDALEIQGQATKDVIVFIDGIKP